MRTAVIGLLAHVIGAFALNELCTVQGVGVGVCIETSRCSSYGGTSTAHLCPGATNIQCCTGIHCDGDGLCMQTSECDGTIKTGLCPGPSTFACCKNIQCNGGQGRCVPRSSCHNGTVTTTGCPNSLICCTGGTGPDPPTPGSGDKIVAAAASQVGKWPYSWGGGCDTGATHGTKQPESPYCDDSKVVGFDCSGLSKYAVFQGTGKSLGHGATKQWNSPLGTRIPYSQKQPGDLIFYGSSYSDIHHVTIYKGGNEMIEAEGHKYPTCVGIPVKYSEIRTKNLIDQVKRFW